MKKTLKETTLQFISKVVLDTAKKEVNSACMCLGLSAENARER